MPSISTAPNLNLSPVGGIIVGDSAPADTEENEDKAPEEPRPSLEDLALLHEVIGKEGKTSATAIAQVFKASNDEYGSNRKGSLTMNARTSLASMVNKQASLALLHSTVPNQLWAALNSLRPLSSVETTVGSVEAKYLHGDEIGRGAMGVVRLSMDRATGTEVAIKTVTLPEKPDDVKVLELELAIARRLKHPNIVRLEEVIKNEEGYHLVMELCNGGNLYDFITERTLLPISTQLHCAYTLQMLSGLAYIHHHRIMHRDIKPDNYVLASLEPRCPLKLTDFGLACNFKKGEIFTQKCGTLYTMAPEIFRRKYTEKCDVWSVGVTIFFLTCGRPPFLGPDVADVEKRIKSGEALFGKAWRCFDSRAEMLVRQMFTVDDAVRPSAKMALAQHRWLIAGSEEEDVCCCCH